MATSKTFMLADPIGAFEQYIRERPNWERAFGGDAGTDLRAVLLNYLVNVDSYQYLVQLDDNDLIIGIALIEQKGRFVYVNHIVADDFEALRLFIKHAYLQFKGHTLVYCRHGRMRQIEIPEKENK